MEEERTRHCLVHLNTSGFKVGGMINNDFEHVKKIEPLSSFNRDVLSCTVLYYAELGQVDTRISSQALRELSRVVPARE